jgi:DNA-binding Xre family transcriptional regulator
VVTPLARSPRILPARRRHDRPTSPPPGNTMSRTPKRTKLERVLRKNRIKPAVLARVSGISRQHIARIRFGRAQNIRTSTKGAIALAVSILTARKYSVQDLFP